MEKPKKILEQEVGLSQYPECSAFGSSRKTPAQNAGCFLAATVGYLKAPAKQKLSELKKFSKYLDRIGQYASDESNEAIKYDLSENKLIAVAFYQLVRHLDAFDFECRKKIIKHLEELCSCRGWSGVSYILNSFALDGDLAAVVWQLINLCTSDDQVLGCAAKVLKLFAQNPETFWVLLDWKIFEKMLRLAGDRNLQIASEFAALLEKLIFSENKKILKSVASFIYDAYYHLFAIIRSSECVLYQRYMIDLVYRLMLQPSHQKFLKVFLNDINQLKETMIGLTAKSESIDFENGLLMSLYISNFEQLSNKKVKKLIVQNKDNLKKALENTHPEIFDAKHEYKFEIPELEEILDRMPQTSVNTQKATDAISACTQLSFGDCSDQASTVHGDSRSRSRFGSVADSERVQPHL